MGRRVMPRDVATSTMIFSTSGSAIGVRGLRPAPLADAPAHVEPRQVAHRERAHREAEVREHPVYLVRGGALEDELLGLQAALMQHPVADEAVTDADEHRHLPDSTADGHRRGDRGL